MKPLVIQHTSSVFSLPTCSPPFTGDHSGKVLFVVKLLQPIWSYDGYKANSVSGTDHRNLHEL